MICRLTKLFNTAYSTGRIPEEWSKAETCPIYKQKGDYRLCAMLPNYMNLYLKPYSAADKGHFLVVTPPHLRTSYNLFFLEYGCIASWKRMVVSLSSL